ncbi:hypothetical protein [uncultured Fusobacterium sp.]|uniref:hypothetical protein n=1 Tax=uncultured Fusobacterium sp. TaxID=159267 RepID=UPI002621A6CF|nr:hypothetical protein [uncultured Fusobacterium sp.]
MIIKIAGILLYITILGTVVYYFKVIIPARKRWNEELKKELEQIEKKCNNCKYMNKFKLTYNTFECYCSDGSIHNKFNYFCKNHKFNDEEIEEAEWRIKFRTKEEK